MSRDGEEGDDPLAQRPGQGRATWRRAPACPTAAPSSVPTPRSLLDGRALGKPADRAAAEAMLRSLSGRTHVVRSAVCVHTQADRRRDAVDETRVTFRALSEPLLAWYLDGGEWRDRAGGYAIQGAGAALVERIEGEYATVVGLPVAALAAALEQLGLAPWVRSGG